MAERMSRGYSTQEEENDLREILFLFQQNLLRILFAAVIGGLVAWSISRFMIHPTYQSTAKIYVVSASNDSVVNLSDLQIGSTLALDYEQLLLTNPVMESTIKNLRLENETTRTLRKKIHINNPKGTRILEITVTSGDPQCSADIANEMAELAITWLPSVMESSAPNIAEFAAPSAVKAAPHCIRNGVIGAVAAAASLYIYYVLAFLLDDTIRTDEDMERYFGIVPLTSIPLESSSDEPQCTQKDGSST